MGYVEVSTLPLITPPFFSLQLPTSTAKLRGGLFGASNVLLCFYVQWCYPSSVQGLHSVGPDNFVTGCRPLICTEYLTRLITLNLRVKLSCPRKVPNHKKVQNKWEFSTYGF